MGALLKRGKGNVSKVDDPPDSLSIAGGKPIPARFSIHTSRLNSIRFTMARLEGLKMQGIRSIGDTPHIINFLHPLTIIQGANGTGKTTIIEALSYVSPSSFLWWWSM